MGRQIYYSNTKGVYTVMIFKETPLKGAFMIAPEILTDERGAFARIFCQKEFENYGLDTNISQSICIYDEVSSSSLYNIMMRYPLLMHTTSRDAAQMRLSIFSCLSIPILHGPENTI